MPIVYYKCSKCKMQRDSFEDAERCEKSHLSAVSVRELEHRIGPYPFRVVLSFPDGREREYIADDGYYFGNEVKPIENNKNSSHDKGYKNP